MTFPAGQNASSEWAPFRASGFSLHVGPILVRQMDGRLDFRFRVEEKHDNTYGRVHGGMIMTFCDEAMGLLAQATRPGALVATISMTCQFLDASLSGEWVEAQPTVARATSSLIFLSCDCSVGGRPVATATGIWKIIGEKLSV